MSKELLSNIDADLREQFLSAIIRYFQTENDKLGLGLERAQIANICMSLIVWQRTNRRLSSTFGQGTVHPR